MSRRLARALGLALLVAILFVVVGPSVAPFIVVPDICRTLTPDDWFRWWLNGCDKDASGGGGGGAG